MTPAQFARVQELYEKAVLLPQAEQGPFLDSCCPDDAEVRTEVLRLLQQVGSVLDDDALKGAVQEIFREAGSDQRDDENLTTPLGSSAHAHVASDSIPGYELVREIHRGGQGVVYQAIQKATKRKVAIKVMREGPFASNRDRSRFEREVEVLGQLNHPRIVAIHDSGVAAGTFYFVMDYISGQPLDVWMAAKERSVDETLRLFAKLCEAISAAHLRGVIHRDIKPGNIRIDPAGEPHVLDFGLAKVASGADASVMTVTGQFIGSLPWASPEQAEAIPERIDIRTDVYSLGVILYQMLTGKFPYDVVGNMRDVLDRILRMEPARPSTIRRQINDEVETIVLKCLSKEPDRRYQSAGELARDINHYLNGEPIEAKRDSTFYILRKNLGRHKGAVLVAGAFLVTLCAGILTSTTLWLREREQRAVAQAKTDEAQHARTDALAAQEQAESSLYRASMTAVADAIEENRFAQARELLWDCPEQHRHWEWGWAMHECNLDIMTLRGHSGPVLAAIYAPDGRTMVTAGQDGSIRTWDSTTGEALRVLSEKGESVNALAFSPDGRFLASGSGSRVEGKENFVRLWEFETGALIRVMSGHTAQVRSLAFTPDGRHLVSGSADWTARLWTVPGGECMRTFDGHTSPVQCVACDPTGRTLATVGLNDNLVLWDLATYSRRNSFRPFFYYTASLAFSSDGRFLLTGSSDGHVRVWNVSTGDQVYWWRPHDMHIWSLALSQDTKFLATASTRYGSKVFLVDTAEELVHLRGHEGPTNTCAFSPDGERVLTAGEDGTARVWLSQVSTGARDFQVPAKGVWPFVTSLAIAPDGARFATSVSECTLAYVWDVASGILQKELGPHGDVVTSVAYSPDGRHLATAADGIRLWDSTAHFERTATLRTRSNALRIAYSPDGRTLVAGCSDGSVELLDVSAGRAERVFAAHSGPVTSLALSPDGEHLVTGGADGQLRLWATPSGSKVWEVAIGSNVRHAAFSSDGARLAVASTSTMPMLLCADTGRVLGELKGHNQACWGVCFSPDGKRVVTGSSDGTVRIWSVETMRQLMSVNRRGAYAVAFTPDGLQLVVGGLRGGAVWSALPWRTDRNSGDASLAAADRLEVLKRRYWQERGTTLATRSRAADGGGPEWEVSLFDWDQSPEPCAHPEKWNELFALEPITRRKVPSLDFNWGHSPPALGMRADPFGLVATTEIEVLEGTYRGRIGMDDGARVLIDGRVVFEAFSYHPFREHTFDVPLSSGRHAVRVEYFDCGGHAELHFDLGPLRENAAIATSQPDAAATPPQSAFESIFDGSLDGVMRAVLNARKMHAGYVTSQDLTPGGIALLLDGNYLAAAEAFRRSMAEAPDSEDAMFNVAWVLLWSGDAAKARETLERIVGKLGSWSPAPPAKAYIRHWTAAYFLGLVSAEQFAEQYRNHPKLKEQFACWPWFYIGQRMEIEGQRDAAIEAYRKSIDLGKLPDAHYVRSWSEYRLGILTGKIPSASDSAFPADTP